MKGASTGEPPTGEAMAITETQPAHVDAPPEAGCADNTPVDADGDPRIDVFCEAHDRFLPLSRLASWQRGVVITAWCAFLCWAVLLAAQTQHAFPLAAAAVTTGMLILILPLRNFRTRRITMTLAWIGASVAGFAFATDERMGAMRLAVDLIIIGTAALWTIWFARHTTSAITERVPTAPTVVPHQRRGESEQVAPGFGVSRLVAAIAATGLAALAAEFILRILQNWVETTTSGALIVFLRVVMILSLVAACVCLIIGAISRTLDGVEPGGWNGPFDYPTMPVRLPPNPRRRRSYKPQRRDPFSMIGMEVLRLVDILIFAMRRVALAIVDGLRLMWYWTRLGCVAAANWVCRWAANLAAIAVIAARMFPACALAATRAVVVPSASIVAAALGVVIFCDSAVAYLLHGALSDLGGMLGAATGTVVALTLAWMAVCNLPWAKVTRSAARSATRGGALTLIVVALGGWTIGLFGTFGHGPIHVGYLTVAATVIVVGGALWTRWGRPMQDEGD